MRKHFFLISNLIFSFYLLIAQCPEGDVILRSQEEVNSFAADYPDCTVINGNLLISSSTINNSYPIVRLIEFENIIEIKGSLFVMDNALNDLNGLQNITTIGDNLSIYSNNNLKNIDGLIGLKTIGKSLSINRNVALENLEGLQHITIIQGDLKVSRNDTLSNLKGLQNISTVGGNIEIENNRNLSNIKDLAGITTIGKDLDIWSNDVLTSLGGFENLTTIGMNLKIGFNPILNLCNIPAICILLNKSTAFPNQIVANGTGCKDEVEILASCIVNITEQNFNTTSLFPNPSTGAFKLSLDETSPNEVSFYLCDTAGQQLTPITTAHQNSNLLDYSHLPNGVYYLNIFFKDEILQKKLIILK